MRLAKILVPLALIAAGAWLARDILSDVPVAGRAETERRPARVSVTTVAPATRGPVVEAWGVVEPARRLSLSPEIGGRVTWVSPDLSPGGFVAEGAELFRLDPREAELAVAEAEARIAEIDARILIEEGQQRRAEQDLSRSPLRGLTDEQRALILREPQEAELEAQRAAAVAARDSATLTLERTTVSAPFDARVTDEEIAVGARLQAGQQVATLVAAGRYHVRLALPPEAVARLDLEPGRPVLLSQPGVWPEGTARSGEILRLDAGLTETGRMAELIVAVPDPLARGDGEAGPPLLLGSFLRAEIAGPAEPGAVLVDRALIRADDTVWVMGEDGRLDVRKVAIGWRGAEEVLVTDGLSPGERLVVTRLATVTDGMALVAEGDGPEAASADRAADAPGANAGATEAPPGADDAGASGDSGADAPSSGGAETAGSGAPVADR